MKIWLAHHGYKVDIVPIHGVQTRDEKFYNMRLFTDKDIIPVNVNDSDPFQPHIGFFTESAAVGVDHPNIVLVFRKGLPESTLNVLQELGRAGRSPGAHSDHHKYMACFNLIDYCKMVTRSFRSHTGLDVPVAPHLLKTSEKKKMALMDLNEVTRELTLPICCFHVRFEYLMSRLHDANSSSGDFVWTSYVSRARPCFTKCSYCNKDKAIVSKKIAITSLKTLLTDIYLLKNGGTYTIPDGFPKLLAKMPNSLHLVHGGKKDSYITISESKILVLRLLAAGIIEPIVSIQSGGEIKMTTLLCKDSNNVLMMNKQSSWSRFPQTNVSE